MKHSVHTRKNVFYTRNKIVVRLLRFIVKKVQFYLINVFFRATFVRLSAKAVRFCIINFLMQQKYFGVTKHIFFATFARVMK